MVDSQVKEEGLAWEALHGLDKHELARPSGDTQEIPLGDGQIGCPTNLALLDEERVGYRVNFLAKNGQALLSHITSVRSCGVHHRRPAPYHGIFPGPARGQQGLGQARTVCSGLLVAQVGAHGKHKRLSPLALWV